MEQHHIIKKQVLDVDLETDIGSFIFKSELSDIYHTEIVPLLEECCNEMSDVSEVLKIDRLEIDLGAIDENNLAEDFKTEVLEHFRKGLTLAIQSLVSRDKIELMDTLANESGGYPGATEEDVAVRFKSSISESEIDLLSYFMKTGRVPWWNRKKEKPDIASLMKKQLSHPETRFKELLEELIAIPFAAKRMSYQFSDELLGKIVEIFSKVGQDKVIKQLNALVGELVASTKSRGLSQQSLRTDVWYKVLMLLKTDPNVFSSEDKLISAVIASLSAEGYGADFSLSRSRRFQSDSEKPGTKQSVDEVSKELSSQPDLDNEQVLAIISQEALLTSLFTGISNALGDNQVLELLADQVTDLLKATGNTLYILLDALKVLEDDHYNFEEILKGSEQSQNQNRHKLIVLTKRLNTRIASLQKQLQAVIRNATLEDAKNHVDFIKPILESIRVLSETLDSDRQIKNQTPTLPDQESVSEITKDSIAVNKLDNIDVQEPPKTRRKNHSDLFTESEELYIANSGLVLFWPYMGRLFESVGVMQQNQFFDREKRERAVILLQYLTQGHQEFREYDLTLNKIICGFDPDYPVPTRIELTEKEIAEADTLIKTVIQHWPVLKNMSPAGLRQMFMAREGMVTIRDNNWLLQVEEQAYDVLIDKIPWQISTIKLPWMQNLIFVEWRL